MTLVRSAAGLARAPLAVCALAAGAILASACGPRATPGPRTPAQVDTAGVLVAAATVNAPLQLPAQLYVEHDAAVVARSAGVIDTVLAELGSRVADGALLAHLESVDQELAVAQTEATYENAGRLVNRARAMTKFGGTTVADSEQVEFQYQQAEISRRKAKRDLELTRITAPFAGVVTARYARAGRYVSPGDTLFRVTEAGPLLARVRVPESSASGVKVGDQAAIAGVSGVTAKAMVLHTSPAFDPASGTREVVLRVASGANFLPGANVTVRLGAERRQVVTVPRELVSPEGFVLVVENGGTAVRPVTVGADVGDGRVEIVSGLTPGERVTRTTR